MMLGLVSSLNSYGITVVLSLHHNENRPLRLPVERSRVRTPRPVLVVHENKERGEEEGGGEVVVLIAVLLVLVAAVTFLLLLVVGVLLPAFLLCFVRTYYY